MLHAFLVRWSCILVLSGLAFARQAPPRGHEATALAALEQARVALEAWRAEVEAGVAVEAASLRRLEAALRSIGDPVEAIMARHQAAQPARAGRTVAASASGAQAAHEIARVWIDDVRAIGAGAELRRAQALAAIREALTSDDGLREWAGLKALQALGDVQYDKAAFRPLVLPFLRDESGGKLVAALYALHNTAPQPGDLALVHATWERRTPELDESMSHLLCLFGERRIEGRSEEIVLELLASPDASVRREGLRGLWGARVGERLAARMIELSADRESRHDAIYFGLSTLQDKSEAVIDVLLETLADPDHNNSGRALWGLGQGVREEQRAKVAAALADLYRARSDPRVREDCERLVRKYGGDEMADALDG